MKIKLEATRGLGGNLSLSGILTDEFISDVLESKNKRATLFILWYLYQANGPAKLTINYIGCNGYDVPDVCASDFENALDILINDGIVVFNKATGSYSLNPGQFNRIANNFEFHYIES